MEAIIGASVLAVNILISVSKWHTVHYEATDNGFLGASAVDSMHAYLVGVRDNVGGILFKTEDGGFTWNEIHPWSIEEVFVPFSTQFLDLNTGYVASIGIIYNLFPVARILKTTDGGNTWTTVYGGDMNFIGKAWEDVFFVDYNNGWAVGANSEILHTSDGGNSWNSQSAPLDSLQFHDVYFLNQNEGWIVGGEYDTLTGEGKNGVILHTSDGGNTWVSQIDNAPYELWDVYFVNSQKGWACGYKDSVSPGLTLKTEDGGNTWNLIMTPEVSLGPYGIYGIEFIDEFTGFAAGAGERWNTDGSYFAVFLKTNDGGNTWNIDTVIYDNQPWGVSPICLDMVSNNWGFAGGTRLSVFRYGPEGAGNREFSDSYKRDILIIYYRNGSVYLNSKNLLRDVELVDITGRIIHRIESFKGTRILELKNGGVYFIRYKNSGIYTTKKLYFFK